MSSPRPNVVILGGGLAGLVTAWELSTGRWQDHLRSITVYQRGWRLGGKGASSRGPHGRIEEHGLHVLLGYYDATFRVLREVYAELDRPRTDPACPIGTWRDAVEPAPAVGLAEHVGDSWAPFVTRFTTNDDVPGEPGAEHRPLNPVDIARRALTLLLDVQNTVAPPVSGGVYLSGSPHPRAATRTSAQVRGGGLLVLAGLLEAVEQGLRFGEAAPTSPEVWGPAQRALQQWRAALRERVMGVPGARRLWEIVDLVVTNVLGMLGDGLLVDRGFERIDHLDYRDWLRRHGADPTTVDSAIIRGMYDLVFAYENGDRSRPRFAAGLGLQLAARMLFDFKGSIFWRMNAGMGEVIFAPLYQALRQRGVRVELFHRLDRIEVVPDTDTVAAVHLTRQAEAATGEYAPLVRVDGLPCWPEAPLVDQLRTDPGPDTESARWSGIGTPVTLRAGQDFDVAVLAVSVGMVPEVAADLIARSSRWQAMVAAVATVGTQAAQVWLDATEAELGFPDARGVTLSGFGDTLDTWASMSHLLEREQWPPQDPPRSLAYFCSALPEAQATSPEPTRAVAETLRSFLDTEVCHLWPAASAAAGNFRWELLHDPAGRRGSERLGAQYVRANVDPSDRYVQSVPGSGRHRIAPGDTGFANLAIAGDWTDCGLNAGCAEAATRSGVLAALAVLEHAAVGTDAAEAGI